MKSPRRTVAIAFEGVMIYFIEVKNILLSFLSKNVQGHQKSRLVVMFKNSKGGRPSRR